jgi:hypothetical protein
MEVLRLERLEQDPGADKLWWEAEVAVADERAETIRLWLPWHLEIAIPGDSEDWVLGELERLSQKHEEPSEFFALSPIELRPPFGGP